MHSLAVPVISMYPSGDEDSTSHSGVFHPALMNRPIIQPALGTIKPSMSPYISHGLSITLALIASTQLVLTLISSLYIVVTPAAQVFTRSLFDFFVDSLSGKQLHLVLSPEQAFLFVDSSGARIARGEQAIVPTLDNSDKAIVLRNIDFVSILDVISLSLASSLLSIYCLSTITFSHLSFSIPQSHHSVDRI